MAFSESTTVSNRLAFLTAFINFAVANAGFTNQGSTVDGADTIYHISKGSIYWNFMVSDHTQTVVHYSIYSRMSFAKVITAANMKAATSTFGQRVPTRMSTYQSTGPYVKYFLYTDGDAVHCVLQLYTGVYTHISFGNVTKFGTWTGGEYLTAQDSSYWWAGGYNYDWDYVRNCILFDGGINNYESGGNYPVGYVRHIVGSVQNDATDFARIGDRITDEQRCRMTTGEPSGANDNGFIYTLVQTCGPINFNARAPIFPVYVRIYEYATARWILSGYISGARSLNIEHLAGETIVENDWIVFPITQKEGGDIALCPLSEYWGVAYKRTA
jgi:hypothetical protein